MNKSMPSVLVIGGGVAGMSAAKTLDAFGISVHLVEKNQHLGGKALDWACMATSLCQNCGACLSAELAEQVKNLKNTNLYLNSNVTEITKNNQSFEAKLDGRLSDPIITDAVLLATGLTPFDPSGISDLGYGIYNQVITTVDLNKILKEDRLKQILPDTKSPEIAFIQCVGSRNREQGRDYCSQVCCKVAVHHVNKILHEMPEAAITMFHIDLQVIGKLFRSQFADMKSRVNLLQGVPGKVLSNLKEGKLSVIHEDAGTGARKAHHFDLIILSVGMLPSNKLSFFKKLSLLSPDKWGFFSKEDSPAKGVYVAGVAQGPTDILTAESQGIIAAHKIIHELNCLSEKKAEKNIVVIGGQIQGVAPALADDGWNVTLLNTGEQKQAQENKGVTCFSDVRISSVSGAVGQYTLSFVAGGENHRINAAAIIVADDIQKNTVKTSEVSKTSEVFPVALSEFVKKFEDNLDSVPETVTFWLDHNGPEWKENARTVLELSIALAEKGKKANVIMEKMLVHRIEGQQLYDNARRLGVRFLRVADSKQVTCYEAEPRNKQTSGYEALPRNQNRIHIEINEATLPGISLKIDSDLLVIPEKVKHSIVGVHSSLQPTLNIVGVHSSLQPTLNIVGVHSSPQPTLWQERDKEGFLQSPNVRHRPVGSPRGIFFVGSCHDEVDREDINREINAVKASLEQLFLINHEKELEQASAVNKDKCLRCLTCYRICPHAAVVIQNNYQPIIIPEACFGCGICVSHCPAKAIEQALSSEGIKDSLSEKTVVFACERSGSLAVKSAENMGFSLDKNTKIITVPCAGQINETALLLPLLNGAEKVIIAGCHEGNCRSMNGSGFAAARADKILSDMVSLKGMIQHNNVAANEPVKIARLISMTDSEKEVK